MTSHYRPQLVWLVMGPLMGAFAGAIVAAVMIWGALLLGTTSTGLGDIVSGLMIGLVLGCIFGGVSGGAVGLVVGVPMAFLVGRHLPRDVARRRAYALGAVLPPLVLFVGSALLFDGGASAAGSSPPGADDLVTLIPLAGAAVLGSNLAAWLAGKDDHARPVS